MSALPRVMALDRRAVRRRFEERFTANRMAKDYLTVYRSLLKRSQVVEKEKEKVEAVSLAPDMTTEVSRAHIDS
jgi:hypothetical protein